MKRFLLLLISLSLGSYLLAQDLVITRAGDSLWGIVKVVTADSIGLESDGNFVSIQMFHKDMLNRLEYANGVMVAFNETIISTAKDTAGSSLPGYDHGVRDAEMYYKGYRTAGTTTLISSLFFPLFGLIPAIACSTTPPSPQSFSIPQNAPISDSSYMRGYQEQAKVIKKKKVWKNYAVGAGVAASLKVVALVVMITTLNSL